MVNGFFFRVTDTTITYHHISYTSTLSIVFFSFRDRSGDRLSSSVRWSRLLRRINVSSWFALSRVGNCFLYNSVNSILASHNDRHSCHASVSDREWPSSPFKNASRGYRIIKSRIIDSVGRHVIVLIVIRSAYHRRLANRACRAKTTLVRLVNTRSRTHVLYPERSMNSFIVYIRSSGHFLFFFFTKKVTFHTIIFEATKGSADDTSTRGIMTGDPKYLNLQHCLKFDSSSKGFHMNTPESLYT